MTTAPAAAAAANPGAPASPLAAAADGPPLERVVASLAALAKEIEAGAADGRGPALRHALADLGTGLEARLASGATPDRAPLRAVLLSLASHPAADAPLARAAAGLADAIAAQPLAGPAMAASAATAAGAGAAAPGAAPLADPAQTGAYLQVPLPGGGTAEVRVAPDGGRSGADGEGAGGPRRLAFLLHLSALGPVMIDASAGAGSVDATVRVGSDEVRAFLDTQAADLAAALRRSTPTASVRVERMTGPAPERLLAPPPASGLDVSA